MAFTIVCPSNGERESFDTMDALKKWVNAPDRSILAYWEIHEDGKYRCGVMDVVKRELDEEEQFYSQ